MSCTFCATGKMGLVRNLTAAEMVGQVIVALKRLPTTKGQDLNIVFMGMGEPLANFSHLRRTLDIICHPAGLGISPRRITVSTSGHLPGIQQLARLDTRPLLALSVNATTSAKRRVTMPIEDVYPLTKVLEEISRWPFRARERILLEYVLLAGENDTADDARRLARMARRFPSTVNVIPLNEHEATNSRRTDLRTHDAFVAKLRAAGALVTVRNSRGPDVSGACGQLFHQATVSPGRRLQTIQ